MLAEVDEALKWAREKWASRVEVDDQSWAVSIRAGKCDLLPGLAENAQAHRAGQASRDAEVAALKAENERLRRQIKDAPLRPDYDSDKSFVDAWMNWQWEYRQQPRAAALRALAATKENRDGA